MILKGAQERKSKIFFAIQNKFGQEEMVGFALIIILVAVIILIFLGFSLYGSEKEPVESYEIESFIQAMLQYTTVCEKYQGYATVRELIFDCYDRDICLDERDACDVLEETIEGITAESWKTEVGWISKGYIMNITSDDEQIVSFKKGNLTVNSKGATQIFQRGGNKFEIIFSVYS